MSILQVLSPRHPAKRVVIRDSPQMLRTQVIISWIAATAHRAPANMLILELTDNLARACSRRRTTPDECNTVGGRMGPI